MGRTRPQSSLRTAIRRRPVRPPHEKGDGRVARTTPLRDATARADGALQEIERALSKNYERLSIGQRRVIDRLLADGRYAAVIHAPELAEELSVSESTVTRAAQRLGFAGYPDMQVRLRERFLAAVPDRLRASVDEFRDEPEFAAIRVMLEDADSVRATAEDLSPSRLRDAVETLLGARRVYVFGSRGSHGLALMLGLGMRLLLPDVRVLSQTAGDLPDQLISLSDKDAVVAISFRRVDRATTELIRQAKEVRAKTVVITDDLSSRMARDAEIVLHVRLGAIWLLPSYAAGASIVNALNTAISLRAKSETTHSLQVAERLWQRFATHSED